MRTPSPLVATLLGLLLSLGAAADDRSAGQHVDDSTLAVNAKAALVRNEDVKANRINVDTAKGVLLLAGFVRSEAEHQAAIKAVRWLNGVEKVVDGLIVQPGERSVGQTLDDTTIQTRLKTRLASIEGAGKALVINSEVRQGEVILSGFLSDPDAIETAGKVAADTPGVARVHNFLQRIP